MLDIRLIRENTDVVREAMKNRQDSAPVDEILELDTERRKKIVELEDLRHERKEAAKERKKDKESAEEGRDLRNMIRGLEDEVRNLDTQLTDLLQQIPNIPQSDVPLGKDEDENVIVRAWGEPRQLAFEPAPHWELGEKLGIIDFDRGVKLSGSRFYVLKGLGARLQRALIAFMLDIHYKEHGYTEVYPPYVVKREMMVGAGQLPKFEENIYHDVEDDLWLVGTAEIPVTNLHRDEILLPGILPLYYVAYTACFRREKMSAGKDTRGIKRGHQFDKVEMYKFTEPENSPEELEKMVANAEDICQKLELPYRIKELCTGDLGFTAVKTYDIEMWAPGCGEWLEVSSCSNCGDFQARRANVRYRPAPDAKPQYVHTLNGSGLALPRVMISIMENYQQEDGTIRVPDVLQDFVGAKVIG
ncbi:serine--tRNA ligase [Chloroflexota bacterium]